MLAASSSSTHKFVSNVLEPGCELPVATVGAADTSDASETTIRDIPALLVTVANHSSPCLVF